ncbi:MAG: hypothetical protein ABIT20_07265 [Gemmatimonadaceae bacterium]
MFDKAMSKFASLFGQLAEIQKDIDDSAKRVVEGIARMIDVVDDEAPSSREALTGRDFSWYQEVTGALAADGFSAPAAYEPRAWMSRPVETRTIVEYSLDDNGAVVAYWFATNATAKRPERRTVNLITVFADGTSVDTVAGGVTSTLPLMDTEHEELLPEGTPVAQLLARHRARIAQHHGVRRTFASLDAYLANRQQRKQLRTAFWRGMGLSLVERYIGERFTGDSEEVGTAYLDAIRKHPEWYKYASAEADADLPAPAAAPARAMPLNFLMSQADDGRRTLTTFGMLFAGLPELLMTDLAANHCRAARVLAGTAARTIARSRSASANDAEFVAQLVAEHGARVTLTRADAIAAGVTHVDGNRDSTPVDVHLARRGFTIEDEPSLLHLDPLPDDTGTFDERLREACARLGVDVPAARGADTRDDAMREAHARAVTRLAEVRMRWKNRAVGEDKVLVKMRASQGEVGEYVWLAVRDWRDDALDGEVVTPAPRVGLTLGQLLTIEESQVYDQLVIGPAGATVPALTDIVATDYGMDI